MSEAIHAKAATGLIALDTAALAVGWQPIVQAFFASSGGIALRGYLAQRVADGAAVFPPQPLRALTLTPLSKVRVVILGQDPYHGPMQADGLAFSVAAGLRVPPSLRNIFTELDQDCGCIRNDCGSLEGWAAQGVLLLNAVLTVEQGTAGSHGGRGWERLTDAIVETLIDDPLPKAFLLWGAQAQARCSIARAQARGHVVLTANHPSPLSARRGPAPFLGCRHFSSANLFLQQHGRGRIDWCATRGDGNA